MERGALFLSALAYPTDDGKRLDFAASLVMRMRDSWGSDRSAIPLTIEWLARVVDRKRIDTAYQNGLDMIQNRRLKAAGMAWPEFDTFFRESNELPLAPYVPTHASGAMLDAIGADIGNRPSPKRGRRPAGGAAEGNRENIKARVWKPSLPSLHLGLAYHLVVERLAETDGFSADEIMIDGELSRRLVEAANLIRPAVVRLFRVPLDKGVQFIVSN